MKRIVKSVTVVGAVLPCLLLAVTAPAHADSQGITWKNARTGLYLTAQYNGVVFDQMIPADQAQWNDVQNSDGSWNEQNVATGMCLLGDHRMINTNSCDARADQTNL